MKIPITPIALVLALISPCALGQEKEDLPEAVKRAIAPHLEQGEIEEVEVEEEGGVTVYEVEIETRGGGDVTVEVAADGTVLEVEIEVHGVPDAVRRAVERHSPKARIVEAEWCMIHAFEVEWRDGDDDGEALIDPLGRVLSGDEDGHVAMGRLPAAVRSALTQHAKGGKITEIEVEPARIEAIYEFEVARGNETMSIAMTGAGDLLEIETEIDPSRLPKRVAAAAKGKITEAETVEIFFYELEVALRGRVHEVVIDASGRFLQDDGDEDDDEVDEEEEDDDEEG